MLALRSFFVILGWVGVVGAAEIALEGRVVEHVCPNGIRVLVLERHYAPLVSIRMMFRTGSVDEVAGKTGLAHMFEHMMFKGTKTLGTKDYQREAPRLAEVDRLHIQIEMEKKKTELGDQARIAQLIEKLRAAEAKAAAWVVENELWNLYEREGASQLNAGTAPDLTQYMVDLPANKMALWAILDSDRLKNPVFRQFYSEREVVKEERRLRVDNNPSGKLYEVFLSTAYMTVHYRNPTIGWEADLSGLSIRDLQEFFERHYTPDRLTIAIVGDVSAREATALVDRHFGDWKKGVRGTGERPQIEPAQTAQRRVEVPFDAEPHILIGFHSPRYPDPDYIGFSALAHLLGDGESSRLHQALVEKKKLATAVSADATTPGERYDPLFVISAAPRHPHTVNDVEQAVFDELDRIKTESIEPWELEKIRARVSMDLLNILQTNDGMADTLAYYHSILGDWRYILRYQRTIDALTGADVQRAAQRLFRRENSTVGTRGPKKSKG